MAAPTGARWFLLGGLIAVYFAFGVVTTSISPMLTLVQDDLGASRGEMGFILGAWAMIFIVTAPIAGTVIDRFGLPLALSVGALSIGLSAVARSQASGVTSLWFAVAVFGLGGPLVSAGAPTLVRRWFNEERERRFAVSAYAVAPGLGSVATLALTNSVLLPLFGSWRRVLLVEGVVAAVALVTWWAAVLVARRSPMWAVTSASGSADHGAGQGIGRRMLALVEDRPVRTVLALAFPVFFLNHAMNNWMPTLLEDIASVSPTVAANVVASSRVVGIVAALVLPNLVPARLRGLALVVVCAVVIGSLGGVFAGGTLAMVAAVAVGVRGLMIPLGALLLMEADGVNARNAGLANGLWFSVGEVGGVSGPFVAGVVAGSAAGFRGVLLVLIGAAAAMAVLALRVDGNSSLRPKALWETDRP